jgi:hypothetical protein
MKNLRCQSANCTKLMGKVDDDGILHIDSKRKGWNIEAGIEVGFVKCKRCGGTIHWDKKQLVKKGQ